MIYKRGPHTRAGLRELDKSRIAHINDIFSVSRCGINYIGPKDVLSAGDRDRAYLP